MSNYQSSYTGAEHDAYVTKQTLINLIYPVGAIYISVNSVSPSTLFGGTWEQIQDTFLLACGSTYSNGATGGEATHTLTTNETPTHTHDKGTMDITGMIRCYSEYNKGNSSYDSDGVSGAFYFRTGTDTEWGTTTNMTEGSNDAVRNVLFKASRSWTGSTSSVGEGPPTTICRHIQRFICGKEQHNIKEENKWEIIYYRIQAKT